MKVVDHGTDAQDVDAILLFDCKEDGQEHKEVPPGVKDDDPVDRSLVNVVDGISAESSFFHCSAFWNTIIWILYRNLCSLLITCVVSGGILCVFNDGETEFVSV
jgi:hypothetical protein